MNKDIGWVHGMSAHGGLHIGNGTTYSSCEFLGSTIQLDANTKLLSCFVEDCAFILPEGVEEVAIDTRGSIFSNSKVLGWKKVEFKT